MNFLINQCYLVSIVKPKIFFEFLNLESILKSALNSLYLKIFCHYCLKKVVQKVPQITWQKQQNSVRKSQKSFDKFKRFQQIMALASARGKLIGVIGDEVSLKIQKIFSLDLKSSILCYFFRTLALDFFWVELVNWTKIVNPTFLWSIKVSKLEPYFSVKSTLYWSHSVIVEKSSKARSPFLCKNLHFFRQINVFAKEVTK